MTGRLRRLVGGELLHIQTCQRVLKTPAEGRRPSALEAAAVVGISSSLKTVALSNPEIPDRTEGVCSHSCALRSSNVAAATGPRVRLWACVPPPLLSGDAIPPLAWLLPLLPGSEATFSGTVPPLWEPLALSAACSLAGLPLPAMNNFPGPTSHL